MELMIKTIIAIKHMILQIKILTFADAKAGRTKAEAVQQTEMKSFTLLYVNVIL
ncbi:hypothetical protein [Candidatus Magnetominusculus xianensis]|uniref:Secreted protein n=1 Tax=Candidatus Magnetominusculus xianensis TaxID=1748249 RepID=A0ABR5SHR2_9BACT|nr:hypothetical protein [Candidatus Magnetominusculus xianensis]KWT86088.1 hypothetical protein ASN18_1575 [Candidatus Magnetominusculus xianensis]MBF0404416.1 hypothetical protein [Nitrospirota bacterium]